MIIILNQVWEIPFIWWFQFAIFRFWFSANQWCYRHTLDFRGNKFVDCNLLIKFTNYNF